MPPFITVPSTGSIGIACVQLTEAAVADDALVLIPLSKYSNEYLFYIAVFIRSARWRFNYGRKITPTRLGILNVISPNEFVTSTNYNLLNQSLFPQIDNVRKIRKVSASFKEVPLTDIFNLERGQFHAIDRLVEGDCPTISRVSTDNGLVGFYKKPLKATLYVDPFMTISTVTGDAFIQFTPFIATDNVLICKPKTPLKITTLVYIQALVNKVKWRYSYGRQCYKRVFQKTLIYLPITDKGNPDENYMEYVVTSLSLLVLFLNKYLKDEVPG